MLRCPTQGHRHEPSCTCLLDAFRSFLAHADLGRGCDSPDCPVSGLDSLTLQRFLEAIGRPDVAGEGTGTGEDRRESPIFFALDRRRRGRKLRSGGGADPIPE